MESKASVAAAVSLFLAIAPHASAQCPQFTQRFSGDGIAGRTLALCAFDDGAGPRLFAGGSFLAAGAAKARGIAVWDGQSWATAGTLPVSTGVVECHALASHDPGTGARLFSGGLGFAAVWDGADWTSIGAPTLGGLSPGSVYALATFDVGAGPELIAGGAFLAIGGVSAPRIARWDGATWRGFGGGLPGPAFALAVHDDGTGSKFYAGGHFDGAVVVWHGTSWASIGQPLGDEAQIDSMASIRGPAGQHWLLVGGQDMFSNNTVFARWDGVQWHSLAAPQFGLVEKMIVHEDALGPIAYLTGIQFGQGFVWSWRPTPALLPIGGMPARGYSLCRYTPPGATEERLIVGGDFAWISGTPAQGVAQRSGSQWSALGVGNHSFIPANGDWRLLDTAAAWTDERDGRRKLVVGGRFAGNADDPTLRNLAVWDGERWSAFPAPVTGAVRILTTWNDPVLGREVLVGYPITVGPPGSSVRKFDGVAWTPIGAQTPFTIDRIAKFRENDGPHETLFILGPFIDSTLGLSRIGRFDGVAWTPVGEGIDGGASSLVVHDPPGPLGPGLYVDTRYLQGGAPSSTLLSRWDGAAWSSVPHPPNSPDAMAVFDDGAGENLFAASQHLLHRFDGTSWTEYPVAQNVTRTSLAVFDDGSGPALYLPDGYRYRGGQVELFEPAHTSANARALVSFEDENGQGEALWFVGDFATFGGVPSRGVARWSDPCRALSTYCTAQTSSLGCVALCDWSGEPSVAASVSTPFEVAARDTLNNKSGLLFYGRRGPNSAPLGGGVLCVRSPIRRTPVVSSGGSQSGDDCSGRLSIDFSPWIQGEVDPSLEIGVQVWCQWWHRDPLAPAGSALSDGLTFEIRP